MGRLRAGAYGSCPGSGLSSCLGSSGVEGASGRALISGSLLPAPDWILSLRPLLTCVVAGADTAESVGAGPALCLCSGRKPGRSALELL